MGDAGVAKKVFRIWNIVHNDEIWKDHVRRENISARHRWPKTWGYQIDEYKKLNSELEGTYTALTPWNKVGAKPREGLTLPVIPDRQKSFPQTTNQQIGWKSTQNGRNSEMVTRYGEQRRGKCTIIRQLNWPRDSVQ